MVEDDGMGSFGTLKLSRAAAVSGEIRDASTDEPIEKLTVMALNVTWSRGQRLFKEGQIAFTDSHGHFRIDEVVPGEYVLEIKRMPLPPIVSSRRSGGAPARTLSQYPLLFWPIGDAASVSPFVLAAGQEGNLGKIAVDKTEPARVFGRFESPNCSDSYRLSVAQHIGGTYVSRYDANFDCSAGFTIPALSPGHVSSC
jgi:hypothetical protein